MKLGCILFLLEKFVLFTKIFRTVYPVSLLAVSINIYTTMNGVDLLKNRINSIIEFIFVPIYKKMQIRKKFASFRICTVKLFATRQS